MMYSGLQPDGVFTAPLKSGSVIVPLGVPGGINAVSCSIGMSNLPDFKAEPGLPTPDR